MKKKHLLVLGSTFALGLIVQPAFAYGPSLNNPRHRKERPTHRACRMSYVPTDVVPYAAEGRTDCA